MEVKSYKISFKAIPWKPILAILILFLAFVFFRSERHEMAQIIPNLKSADYKWIIVGIFVIFLYVFLQGLMYVTSFKSVGLNLDIGSAVDLFLKRNFLSVFLPAGGISSLAYNPVQIRRKKFSKTLVYQAAAIYAFVGLLTVFIIGIPVIIYSATKGIHIKNSWFSIIVLGVILFMLYYVVKSFKSKNNFYQFLEKKTPDLVKNIQNVFNTNVNRRSFWTTVIISLFIEFCGILHAYIAMYALGLNVSFEAAALGYTIAVLLMIISPFLRGLGAVEFTMIYIFTKFGYTHSQALALTILYRIFEFWGPAIFGLISFFWIGRKLLSRIFPAISIFILGLVNIISVITPPLMERLHLMNEILPMSILHLSKISVLILGIALLITSSYLIKGLKTAWYLALIFSVLSLLGNIVKAFDYEESIVALVTIIFLAISWKQYRLKTNFKSLHTGFSIFFGVFFSVLIFNFLSFYFMDSSHFGINFSWKQSIYYTLQTFLLFNESSLIAKTHFAKDFVDINFFFGFLSWILLIRAVFKIKKYHSSEKDTMRAKEILEKYGSSSLDYFKTMADKSFFFSKHHTAFISYRIAKNFAIVLEEPVSLPTTKKAVIKEFENFCEKTGLKSAYYRVGEESMHLFEPLKKQKLLIGQEGIIDVEKFNLQGKNRKSLRNSLNALEKNGYKTELLSAPQTLDTLNKLKSVSDEWIKAFDKKEVVFAEGKFDFETLKNQDIIVVKSPESKIVTFMNIIKDYKSEETTYDMIRRTEDAPGGSMDACIIKLIDTSKEKNIKFVNIGLTPLSGINEPDSIAEEVIRFAYQRLKEFKQYQTMRSFKEKYADMWENKYVIYGNDMELLQLPAALNQIMKP